MISITKIFTFEAAHHLPNYDGLCRYAHGHSYRLEVTVEGDIDFNRGTAEEDMVVDFGRLKKVVDDHIISKYDHKDLNDFFSNPTAETLVKSFFYNLQEEIAKIRAKLTSIKLWETATSYAEWKRND